MRACLCTETSSHERDVSVRGELEATQSCRILRLEHTTAEIYNFLSTYCHSCDYRVKSVNSVRLGSADTDAMVDYSVERGGIDTEEPGFLICALLYHNLTIEVCVCDLRYGGSSLEWAYVRWTRISLGERI
ncbi:hypothetical protein Tco_0571302 [Tanacetum coccineum]